MADLYRLLIVHPKDKTIRIERTFEILIHEMRFRRKDIEAAFKMITIGKKEEIYQ